MDKKKLKVYGIIGQNIGVGFQVESSLADQLNVGTILEIGKKYYEIRGIFEKNEQCMINLCFVKNPVTQRTNRISLSVEL